MRKLENKLFPKKEVVFQVKEVVLQPKEESGGSYQEDKNIFREHDYIIRISDEFASIRDKLNRSLRYLVHVYFQKKHRKLSIIVGVADKEDIYFKSITNEIICLFDRKNIPSEEGVFERIGKELAKCVIHNLEIKDEQHMKRVYKQISGSIDAETGTGYYGY